MLPGLELRPTSTPLRSRAINVIPPILPLITHTLLIQCPQHILDSKLQPILQAVYIGIGVEPKNPVKISPGSVSVLILAEGLFHLEEIVINLRRMVRVFSVSPPPPPETGVSPAPQPKRLNPTKRPKTRNQTLTLYFPSHLFPSIPKNFYGILLLSY